MAQFLIRFYLVVLLASFITSMLNWKQQKREDTVLSLLLLCTFISETASDILVTRTGNNLIVSHIFGPVQFLLFALYYNSIISSFKKNNIGLYIGVTGVLLSAANSLFVQKISTFNSYFVLFEAFAIIFMSLHYFLEMIRKSQLSILKNKHFWIVLTFLSFWSITYTYWALSEIISANSKENFLLVFYIFACVNILTYGGLAAIFILNKKKVLHNEY